MGAKPIPPKHTCISHPNRLLVHLPCTGNAGQACRISVQISDDQVLAKHNGIHNHPQPPPAKPHPSSLRTLERIVQAHPDACPAQLRFGVPGELPLPDIDPAFFNEDLVAHHRRKIKNKKISNQSVGISSSTAAFFQLVQDTPMPFFRDVKMVPGASIITCQSSSMRQVLNDNRGGMQSCTVAGCIHEPDFKGEIYVHFTSCYDKILQRWVPVLASIMLGEREKCYVHHWRVFFDSFENIRSWSQFENQFLGVTMNWSESLGSSFIDALIKYSMRFPDGRLTHEQARSFVRRCKVHFELSLSNIIRNGRIIKSDEEAEEFLELVWDMCDDNSTRQYFRDVCREIATKFPGAKNWLKSHLHPNRATCFFPACRKGWDQKQKMSWRKLPANTNDVVNIGEQFQGITAVPGRKLTVNEAALGLVNFSNSFDHERAHFREGGQTKHNQHPRVINEKQKKRKRLT